MTNRKLDVGDIVTIAKDYKDSANLDFAQSQIHVYSVMAINADGTITLAGVWPDIPDKYIEGVPLYSELAKQIYYDKTFLGRRYEVGNVRNVENISARKPFMIIIEENMRSTPLWEAIKSGKFRFVHELQQWIEKNIAHDRIKINQFWQ